MQTVKHITVTSCINHCNFYFKSMDGMECNHPFFDDKPTYTNMIITNDLGNKIPELCPLRLEGLILIYTYELVEEK